MTNNTAAYRLPETDRVAHMVNPILDEVAQMPAEFVGGIEIGAITLIGLFREAQHDMFNEVAAAAEAQGEDPQEAVESLALILTTLAENVDRRADHLRKAIRVAEGVEPTENPLVTGYPQDEAEAMTEEEGEDFAEEFVTALFTAIFGEEVTQQVKAEVARRDAEGYDWFGEDFADEEADEDEGDWEPTDEEVQEFLASLFGDPGAGVAAKVG